MLYSLIDSHCHLQLAAYANDANAVLGNALEQGIGMIVVGTNLETSAAAARFAEAAGDGVWAAIAVHPGHTHRPHHDLEETSAAPTEEKFDAKAFAALAASPKVVAVGETGLDHYRIAADERHSIEDIKKKQQDNLIEHINFAKQRGLPLILHVRDAHEDALGILTEHGGSKLRCVMHCFTGTVTDAERYLELGYYISFTGALTYPPRKGRPENDLHPVARMVPADRLLVETDAPWLTPAPLRGRRNEPANVKAVAQALAALRGVSYEEIAEMTVKNTVKLFNLAKPARP